MCVHICVCMYRPEVDIRYLPIFYPVFLRQTLPESLELANELDWLASQTKESSRVPGLQVHTRVHTSYVCAGIRSRVLMLMKQALYHCV